MKNVPDGTSEMMIENLDSLLKNKQEDIVMNGTKYFGTEFFKGCLPQTLLGPFFNNLTHMLVDQCGKSVKLVIF